MQYTTFSGRAQWIWHKNRPNVMAMLYGRLPSFVLRDIDRLELEIPIFTFHSVRPEEFEACCLHLCDAGYRTIGLDEFADSPDKCRNLPAKSVILTFDDGLASLWSVAYPLLERYGMRATAFVIPGLVRDRPVIGPTLRDVWDGSTTVEDIVHDDEVEDPLASWEELRIMQNSGVVDIQSHTLYHARAFCGPRLRDFVNPNTPTDLYRNVGLPVTSVRGRYRYDRPLVFGQPLYSMQPVTAGLRRYVDDEWLRDMCQEFVARNGGPMFFTDKGWRSQLAALVRKHRRRSPGQDYFEPQEDYVSALTEEIAVSKSLIEDKLHNRVRHLCFPWYAGSDVATTISRRVGYRTNLWGANALHVKSSRMPDPYRLGRLDHRLVFRLPGAGRRSIKQLLSEQLGIK